MDLRVRTPHLPAAGETFSDPDFATGQGGKGANQAIAAARAGGRVAMIGAVGDDAFGAELLDAIAHSRRRLRRRPAARRPERHRRHHRRCRSREHHRGRPRREWPADRTDRRRHRDDPGVAAVAPAAGSAAGHRHGRRRVRVGRATTSSCSSRRTPRSSSSSNSTTSTCSSNSRNAAAHATAAAAGAWAAPPPAAASTPAARAAAATAAPGSAAPRPAAGWADRPAAAADPLPAGVPGARHPAAAGRTRRWQGADAAADANLPGRAPAASFPGGADPQQHLMQQFQSQFIMQQMQQANQHQHQREKGADMVSAAESARGCGGGHWPCAMTCHSRGSSHRGCLPCCAALFRSTTTTGRMMTRTTRTMRVPASAARRRRPRWPTLRYPSRPRVRRATTSCAGAPGLPHALRQQHPRVPPVQPRLLQREGARSSLGARSRFPDTTSSTTNPDGTPIEARKSSRKRTKHNPANSFDYLDKDEAAHLQIALQNSRQSKEGMRWGPDEARWILSAHSSYFCACSALPLPSGGGEDGRLEQGDGCA